MLLKRLAAIVLLACSSLAVAEDESARVAVAQPVVSAWIALMDAGQYEECWNSLSESMKTKMPKNQWFVYINGARKPLGAVKTRKQIKAEYVPSLKNSPDQDAVIFTFVTSFDARSDVRETFGVIHDKDGQWRVGHYLTN